MEESLHGQINHEILSSRPQRPRTQKQIDAFVEATQLVPWKTEADADLVHCEETMKTISTQNRVITNWAAVVGFMQHHHDITLTERQWRDRLTHLRKTERKKEQAHSQE